MTACDRCRATLMRNTSKKDYFLKQFRDVFYQQKNGERVNSTGDKHAKVIS